VAVKYGIDAATILKHLQYVISVNRANEKNLIDGRTWYYHSFRAFAILWPFWTEKHIERELKKLVDNGVLLKGNHNRNGYDRTTWWAFEDEESWILSREAIRQKRRKDSTKMTNRFPKSDEPIQIQIQNKNIDITNGKSSLEVSELVLQQDTEIVQGKKRFFDALDRILKPRGERERKTFARMLKHFVDDCQSGQYKTTIFDELISWMKEAQADGDNPKALFVSIVKERTQYKPQRRRLIQNQIEKMKQEEKRKPQIQTVA
jgi:hypothetical protein